MTRFVTLPDGKVIPRRKSITTARICDIVEIVSKVMRIKPADILGPRRLHHIVLARQACYLLAREAGHSYSEIGRRMSRDHVSALYGAGRCIVREDEDGDYAALVKEARRRVVAAGRYAPPRPALLAQFMVPASLRVEQRGMELVA